MNTVLPISITCWQYSSNIVIIWWLRIGPQVPSYWQPKNHNAKHNWKQKMVPFHCQLWKWAKSCFLQILGWCSEKSQLFNFTFVPFSYLSPFAPCSTIGMTGPDHFPTVGDTILFYWEDTLQGIHGKLSILGQPEKCAGRYPIGDRLESHQGEGKSLVCCNYENVVSSCCKPSWHICQQLVLVLCCYCVVFTTLSFAFALLLFVLVF